MFGPLRNYFRRAGHRHRDAKRWGQAADAYGRHVRLHPHDLGDWVRLAEMSLAAGRPEAAERAYARALREAPRDAHIAFQLAQSLKRIGRDEDALATFKLSLQLSERMPAKPTDKVAVAGSIPPDGMVLYSVQDLIGYLRNHPTVTGIQRVQLGIVRHVMAIQGDQAGFVMTDAEPGLQSGDFWLLDRETLTAVMREAEAAQIDHVRLKARIADCRRTARAIRPGTGHTLILLGAFWALGNAPPRYFAAKRRGARIGAYVYDLIPVSHPQFCEMELSLHFGVSLGQMAAIADFILTISEDTADRVRTLLMENGRDPIPVQAVPLTQTRVGPETLPPETDGRGFVAYVSTIEARKNHIYVVRVWQALIARGVDVPDLVFVGRLGWKIGPLLTLLEETAFLDGRMRLRHDLTDAQLAAVYRDARFTVFSSFIEGWGLPIGESLAHGTPCVVSNTASMPEAGGDFADYLDPTDIEDGIAVIGHLLTDPDVLADRRRRIADGFTQRTWDHVGSDFLGAVQAQVSRPVRPIAPPLLKAGEVFRPGNLADDDFSLETLIRSPRGLLLIHGFQAPDAHGAWLEGSRARIVFRSDRPPGAPIRLTVGLHRGGNGTGTMMLTSGGSAVEHPLDAIPVVGDPPLHLQISTQVGDDGTVELQLALQGGAASVGRVSLGLASLHHEDREPA